ncbi:MAG TPA: hypothetical protein VD735_02240 [Candidatus Saccharimonadales bacterium]|nr:hypothetical protein [Candidatus Saccharimonadales bacterium]
MDLQETFYLMGIIYMAIMFILMIAAVIAVFAIKKKIDHIHHNIEQKLAMVTNIAHAGSELVEKAKSTFKKHA